MLLKKRFWLSLLALVCIAAPFIFRYFKRPVANIFTTTKPERKTITRVIEVSGQLEIKDCLKIGSLIPGIVKKICVVEGEQVREGAVLAKIDNGKDNADVAIFKADAEQFEALLIYQRNHFARIKELHLENFVSQDEFELERSKLSELESRLQGSLARLNKAQIEFENTEIKAPRDGKVTAIRVTLGQAITATHDATVLFELASDISAMQAVFEVDDSDVVWLEKNQDVELVLSGQTEETIKTKIDFVSLTPRIKNNITYFKVLATVNDPAQKLRSGISVNAIITTAKVFDALSLPGQTFYLSTEAVTTAAKMLNYNVVPLASKKPPGNKKFLWTLSNETFAQKEVEVGINDNVSFQILTGIEEGATVLLDIDEKNLNEDLFKQAFKKI